MTTVEWLLDSDPALRWQVQRDLLGEPEPVWSATRTSIATHGFGARLLAEQDDDGQWAGGAFFPRDFTGTGPQPWTATTWSLNMLREWGLDASALTGTADKLAISARWEYDDLPYWNGEVDCCINAYTLANGVWLGADVDAIARWLTEHRMVDGGWNCEWVEGSTRSSFHSTLNALKGLLAYDAWTGGSDATRAARRGGEDYLLCRSLFRRLSTGKLVGPWALPEFTYPFRWRYDVLRACDYFRASALHDGTGPDPRISEAVDYIRSRRRPDGTWHQGPADPGAVWFDVDAPEGEPSQWLTFYATRVLDWFDGSALT